MSAINYPEIMAQVLRGVVAAVLKVVSERGLPEQNYFIMDFRSDHPGVEIPERLREQYPEEMRIVLQHWFEDLTVGDAGFWVTLSFNNVPEQIYVPLASLLNFSDPGAGVKFSFPQQAKGAAAPETDPGGGEDAEAEPAKAGETSPESDSPGKVVSLDQFRKT